MQRLAVLAKILGAGHEGAHCLERGRGARVDLGPGAAEAVDGRGAERRDDGREGREVVELAAFLSRPPSARIVADGRCREGMGGKRTEGGTYVGHRHEMLDHHHPLLHVTLRQDHLGHPVRQLVAVQDERFHVRRRLGLVRAQLLLPRLVQTLGRADLAVQPALDDGQLAGELGGVDVEELELLHVLGHDGRRRLVLVQVEHQHPVRRVLAAPALLDHGQQRLRAGDGAGRERVGGEGVDAPQQLGAAGVGPLHPVRLEPGLEDVDHAQPDRLLLALHPQPVVVGAEPARRLQAEAPHQHLEQLGGAGEGAVRQQKGRDEVRLRPVVPRQLLHQRGQRAAAQLRRVHLRVEGHLLLVVELEEGRDLLLRAGEAGARGRVEAEDALQLGVLELALGQRVVDAAAQLAEAVETRAAPRWLGIRRRTLHPLRGLAPGLGIGLRGLQQQQQRGARLGHGRLQLLGDGGDVAQAVLERLAAHVGPLVAQRARHGLAGEHEAGDQVEQALLLRGEVVQRRGADGGRDGRQGGRLERAEVGAEGLHHLGRGAADGGGDLLVPRRADHLVRHGEVLVEPAQRREHGPLALVEALEEALVEARRGGLRLVGVRRRRRQARAPLGGAQVVVPPGAADVGAAHEARGQARQVLAALGAGHLDEVADAVQHAVGLLQALGVGVRGGPVGGGDVGAEHELGEAAHHVAEVRVQGLVGADDAGRARRAGARVVVGGARGGGQQQAQVVRDVLGPVHVLGPVRVDDGLPVRLDGAPHVLDQPRPGAGHRGRARVVAAVVEEGAREREAGVGARQVAGEAGADAAALGGEQRVGARQVVRVAAQVLRGAEGLEGGRGREAVGDLRAAAAAVLVRHLALRSRRLVLVALQTPAHEHLGRRPRLIGPPRAARIPRPLLVERRGRAEGQVHLGLVGAGVVVVQPAVVGDLGNPPRGLVLVAVGIVVRLRVLPGPRAEDRVLPFVVPALLIRARLVGRLVARRLAGCAGAGAVGVRRVGQGVRVVHDAVVAWEPAAHAAQEAVPPAALELGDDLDDVALAEAQAGAVVPGLVVVQRAHIAQRRRHGRHGVVRGRSRGRCRGGRGHGIAVVVVVVGEGGVGALPARAHLVDRGGARRVRGVRGVRGLRLLPTARAVHGVAPAR